MAEKSRQRATMARFRRLLEADPFLRDARSTPSQERCPSGVIENPKRPQRYPSCTGSDLHRIGNACSWKVAGCHPHRLSRNSWRGDRKWWCLASHGPHRAWNILTNHGEGRGDTATLNTEHSGISKVVRSSKASHSSTYTWIDHRSCWLRNAAALCDRKCWPDL